MDTEILVDRDIDVGRRLIQALDQAGFPVVAAFWSYFPEAGEWRLVIASPKVSELGPLKAYKAIRQVLLESPIGFPLHRTAAVGLDDPLVTELRFFAGTDPAPFIGGTSLRKEVIGNTYVEGAYVYRAERVLLQSGTIQLLSVTRNRPQKVWTVRRTWVTFENGLCKKIEVEGFNWPQTQTKNGFKARLDVLANAEVRDGEPVGDVQRWTILGGRLRSVETVARRVRLEGFPVSPSATSAAV